jgi:two-component system, NtrC family, sensor kinase
MKDKDTMTWKALVIDDEAGIRKVLSIALSDAGCEVITASDGKEGLRLCMETSPQIVLTDIRMPGMNGLDLLRTLKAEEGDKEVIVITGFGDMDLAIRALQLDASDFITKPIHNDALMVALKRAKERYLTRKDLHDYTSLMEERWITTAEELARTFNFQSHLIESSIDGIMGWDRDGRVVTFNRSMEKMLGFSKQEVRGKVSFHAFFAVGAAEAFSDALRSGDFGGKNRLMLYETTLLDRNGAGIPVQLSATVLMEEDQEIGMVGFFRDLREIRRLEQQFADQASLLHQDKMISLGRLAASVVHEINNPLTGVLNYIRLMLKIMNRDALNPDQLDKFKRYLTLIEGETGRCSRIVSNLLAFSRKSQTEFTDVDVNELIQKCILLSRHKVTLQDIEIRTFLDPGPPKVHGDYNQIQQALINLIFNAVDAMPDGGTLSLASILMSSQQTVQIRVADTGCGIPREDMDHLFEPFYTTKKEGKGLGLGLATVQGIVERHRGRVCVESESGKGSVFTIELPVRAR